MSSFSSFDALEQEIARVKDEFYSESGGKNLFFKKQQKFDCAKQILSQIPIEKLLQQTCYNIPGTNKIYIGYPIIKQFASPETFNIITDYIIDNFKYVTSNYPNFEVILNLDGFTISAAERYKPLIEVFCLKCFQLNTGFSQVVNKFVVYNSPNAVETIKPMVYPFMEENVKSRLIILLKKDSDEYNRMVG